METIRITRSMRQHLEEVRTARKRYEAASGEKVIGAGYCQADPEKLDKIELVNAVIAAKHYYESLAMEAEIMKGLREQWAKSGSI